MSNEGGTKRSADDWRRSSGYMSDPREESLACDEEEPENDVCTRLRRSSEQTGVMEKKKRFLRPSSFIARRKSPVGSSTKGNVKQPTKSNEKCTSIDAGIGNELIEEKNDAFEQCKRLKTELETSNDKVDQYQAEVELLRSQLRSFYRKELKANDNLSTNTDCDDEMSSNGPTKAVDIRPNISYIACSDSESDPSEHHTRPCKECEKLLLTRVSALVEAITLRRYVLQLSKMSENGEKGTEMFLSENERKLTKTLAEKELLARQLKSVVRERDKVLLERDRALEEWEKAASKWETTLDQLDTLMIQQNEAKEHDNKVIAQLKSVITQLEDKVKEKEKENEELQQRCTEMEEQLSTSKKETKECMNEHDVVLKANYNIAQELRRVNGELKESQTECTELQSAVEKAQVLLDRNKVNNEHVIKQWKHTVKEKKKLQRDISSIIQSRDEAIQRNLSTLAQLDRVREERERLARRLKNVEGNDAVSDISESQCSLAECQFCNDSTGSMNGTSIVYDEINVFVSKTALSDASISLDAVVIGGDTRVVVTKVDDFLVKHHNMRKYDDLIAINQQSIDAADVEKARKVIEGGTDLNLTLRRYKTPFKITFETEIPIPKKSKLGCGIHWGVYIRDLRPQGLAHIAGNMETGDYINTINGKNLTKILSSALDKYSKRGDKMIIEVARKLTPCVQKCNCHYNSMRRVNIKPRDKYPNPNRDSVISVESNHSLGASSISSIPSFISSMDSTSVCSPPSSECDGYFRSDRKATSDIFSIEAGVPPTIAEECSTDSSIFHSRNRRVRSLSHIGKPRHTKKEYLPRSQSLANSLNSENSLKIRSMSQSSGRLSSNGSVVSVKRVNPVSTAAQPVVFTVPVSRERTRVIRLDKRTGESLGLKINGGNCVGIYVIGFGKQSLAEEAGVRVGDRLLQLNSYNLSQVTLDYATRIVRMLGPCNYIRMEVQNYSNVDDVLKEGTLDSLYVRARFPYTAKLPDELSYNIGDKLRVINSRADYDVQKQTWRWFAIRERPGENGEKVEGLIPAMNYSPENDETGSAAKSPSSVQRSGGDDGVLSDDNIRRRHNSSRRNSIESLSKLRRFRGSKRTSSIESLPSESDCQSENKTTNYYEILQEQQV